MPAHLTKKIGALKFKQSMGREQVDVHGRRLDKSLFNLSKDEISSMTSLDSVNFVDFLPNSIKLKKKT